MPHRQASVQRSFLKAPILLPLSLVGILITCSFSLCGAGLVIASSPDDLGKRVERLIRESGAEAVAVSYYDLATGAELQINPDTSFHAASTMKVPVMMEIFRQAAAGKVSPWYSLGTTAMTRPRASTILWLPSRSCSAAQYGAGLNEYIF